MQRLTCDDVRLTFDDGNVSDLEVAVPGSWSAVSLPSSSWPRDCWISPGG